MNVLLKDFQSNKLRNLALMKLSTYHKGMGDHVFLNNVPAGTRVDKVYVSVVFDADLAECRKILDVYPAAVVGGGAWDKSNRLPPEVEACKPDWDLYSVEEVYQRVCGGLGARDRKIVKAQEIVNAGIGYTTRGCVRRCGFCDVWRREGGLHQADKLGDILNPQSNMVFLLDNNLSADPLALDKLREIRERGLVVEITQGIDVRLMTDQLANGLAGVKHRRSIHYSWDLAESEAKVVGGIKLLSRYIKAYRHKCYMLVGWNSVFEEDLYRFRRLRELGVDPYVMIYRGSDRVVDEKATFDLADVRLHHFARWVNGYFFKKIDFDEYIPWIVSQRATRQTSLSLVG